MVITKDRVLITGAAGFIGASLSIKFLKYGAEVFGLDNLNSYYDVNLKLSRIRNIEKNVSKDNKWYFKQISITDTEKLKKIFYQFRPSLVVNLAAQAGVRYSLENPQEYINSNLVGFGNILENCREIGIEHLIYASSSSVYGGNTKFPFDETQKVDNPISLYAATKVSNELMANSYSHLYKIPTTGLRFFTVYGPWGRPDMAPMIFAKSILENKPINVFNYGKMQRDFTYINDIIEGIFKCCFKKPQIENLNEDVLNKVKLSSAPHQVFNIGNSKPIELLEFIEIMEKWIGIKAKINFSEIQPGDVIKTYANTTKLSNWINYSPTTSVEEGIKTFIQWYKSYFKY